MIDFILTAAGVLGTNYQSSKQSGFSSGQGRSSSTRAFSFKSNFGRDQVNKMTE